MKFSLSSVLSAASLLLSATVSAAPSATTSAASSSNTIAPPLEIKGNKFFYSNNGSQFYLKGVAYQEDSANASAGALFSDPLADGAACKRDLPYLLELETNVIRVYAVNTSLNHDDCINLFAENGIYILSDLSAPGLSIDRASPSWDVDLFNRYTSVIDELQGYSNVLGFFAGNEVTNNISNTDASPFVKAAIRDMKSYISAKGYRDIPIGYASNDDAATRDYLADYFNCGPSDQIADFYGLNIYEWCGSTVNFVTSGYQARTEEFANYTVPIFFSEYGCNIIQPRQFDDVPSLYGPNMTNVWSGGIVYMYFEEVNNYGLVSIESDGDVSTLADFDTYSSKIHAVDPSSVNSASFTPTNTVQRACPASTLSDWKANTALPPTPNEEVCGCMSGSLECVVADSVSPEDYADLFSFVCAAVSCDGINGDGSTGQYGSYSFCSDAEKLSFVLNLYYNSQNKNSQACDFSGSASLLSSTSAANSQCKSILSAAGTEGTGSVSIPITAEFTGASGTSGSSGSGSTGSSGSAGSSSSASASKSKAAASGSIYGPQTVNIFGVKAASAVFGSLFVAIALAI